MDVTNERRKGLPPALLAGGMGMVKTNAVHPPLITGGENVIYTGGSQETEATQQCQRATQYFGFGRMSYLSCPHFIHTEKSSTVISTIFAKQVEREVSVFKVKSALNGSNGEHTNTDDMAAHQCSICQDPGAPVFRRPRRGTPGFFPSWASLGTPLENVVGIALCGNHFVHEGCAHAAFKHRARSALSCYRHDYGFAQAPLDPLSAYQCPTCRMCAAPPRALTSDVVLEEITNAAAVDTNMPLLVGAAFTGANPAQGEKRAFVDRLVAIRRQYKLPIHQNQLYLPGGNGAPGAWVPIPNFIPALLPPLIPLAMIPAGFPPAAAPQPVNQIPPAPVVVHVPLGQGNVNMVPPVHIPAPAAPLAPMPVNPAQPQGAVPQPANPLVVPVIAAPPPLMPLIGFPIGQVVPVPPNPAVPIVVPLAAAAPLAVVQAINVLPGLPIQPAQVVAANPPQPIGPGPGGPNALVAAMPDPNRPGNLINTVLFLVQRPTLMIMVVYAIVLFILNVVVATEVGLVAGRRVFIAFFSMYCWEVTSFMFMNYRMMVSARIATLLVLCINYTQHQSLDCRVHQGSGLNPAEGEHAVPLYGKYNQMGVEVSVISTAFTHYRYVLIYDDVFRYIWLKRAGSSDNSLIMSWIAGEVAQKFKIEEGYERERVEFTIHVAYQCIVSARRKEAKVQYPGQSVAFNRVFF